MILENPVGFLNGLPAVRYMYLGSLTLEVPPWNLEYQIDYLNKRGGFYRFKMILEGRSLSQWLPAVAKISIDTTSYWLPAVAKCICGLRPQSKSISVEGTTSSNLFEVVSSSLYINYHMLDSVMLDRMTRHPIDYYNVTSDFRFKGNSYGGVDECSFARNAIHDDVEREHHDPPHVRHQCAGVGIRRPLSAIRNRERSTDPDVIRWTRLHDDHDCPRCRRDRARSHAGVRLHERSLPRRDCSDYNIDDPRLRWRAAAVHNRHRRAVEDRPTKDGGIRVLIPEIQGRWISWQGFFDCSWHSRP